ncbi:MucR family transcriptional regulator [Methylobacterium phyllostachyos]|uniref:MucR family transcriptional regulator n=1 Tax=Methylobacterium phyllostachyos TaxID=582672 RepID=UPI001FCD7C19|nr:MucR family transcriptional regulator [Methylobacterium phyllostachyos]
MNKSEDALQQTMHTLAVRLVKAYLSNNSIPPASVPPLLAGTHATLLALMKPPAADSTPVPLPSPSEIRRSVQPDRIVSFIDGRSLKTLKRHLAAHGLTPDQYRRRYGLPPDYPMTAPAYATQRSQIAKGVRLERESS